MIRVLLVSPLPAVRAGLRALIGAADDLAVIGESVRYEPGRVAMADVDPDVVVIDPDDGFGAAELALAAPEAGPGLVILGPVPADRALAAELDGRAWAYLPRGAGGEALVAAVRAVGHGLVAIDPALGGHLLARPAAVAATPPESELGEELTPREREVLELVALGLANKTVAARLGISEHTVKFHVAAILAKLGAGSRTEAVHLGARRGLVAL